MDLAGTGRRIRSTGPPICLNPWNGCAGTLSDPRASAALREIQAERLDALPDDLRERIEWISQPPSSPFQGVIVANEVMDALPVACFVMTADGPVERCVGVESDRLVWTQAPPSRRLSQGIETLQEVFARAAPGRLPKARSAWTCRAGSGRLPTACHAVLLY